MKWESLVLFVVLLVPLVCASPKVCVHLTLIINYGDGVRAPNSPIINVTSVSYNLTVPRGTTLFNATLAVANVTFRVGPHGVYILSINGLCERVVSRNEGYSWLWYLYDEATGGFVLGPVACDKYVIRDGDVIMWKYSHWKF